ncbi:MAG: hypothetical protein KDJ16_16855 [Hyphomicrobiales bacterium]|nr:hypothetical protein [Hyphomicrobiales bacterium]MCC2113708.1 hypothetical protein [Hyphomicrobiales bacterium]
MTKPADTDDSDEIAGLRSALLFQSDDKQVRWPAWFALNGVAYPSMSRGSRFDRSFLAIAAAADGLGVACPSSGISRQKAA